MNAEAVRRQHLRLGPVVPQLSEQEWLCVAVPVQGSGTQEAQVVAPALEEVGFEPQGDQEGPQAQGYQLGQGYA